MSDLCLTAITKRFGAIAANDNINLTVREGSIHGLLGENGAGKSTLMNILSGLYQPDSGEISLAGERIQIESPANAIRHGIGMIHQHFMLVNQLTVVENVILGHSSRRSERITSGLRLNLKEQSEAIAQLGKTYGLEVPPMAVVSTLPVGIQQRVEILKVLYRQARILILDEPTAVLTPTEIQSFLKVLRQLAARNHTIIFISHKLDEVMAVCDEVTILRRGQVVASLPTHRTNRSELARLMVDRTVEINTRSSPQPPGDIVLDIKELWVNAEHRRVAALRGLSFQIRAGEIFGIAGVDGNGQRELADAIAHLLPIQKGSIEIASPTTSKTKSKLKSKTIAYIPEDRQKQGLILSFSIARNLVLNAFSKLPFCRRWILRRKEIAAHAQQAIQSFDIRASSPLLKASQLSGGNQQKIILARELAGEPALIIAMQPTRGLDIGATAAVQQSLREQRAQGAAILYISTELEDVMAMSDRLGIIYRGQLVDVLDPNTATLEHISLLMGGHSPQKNQEMRQELVHEPT